MQIVCTEIGQIAIISSGGGFNVVTVVVATALIVVVVGFRVVVVVAVGFCVVVVGFCVVAVGIVANVTAFNEIWQKDPVNSGGQAQKPKCPRTIHWPLFLHRPGGHSTELIDVVVLTVVVGRVVVGAISQWEP